MKTVIIERNCHNEGKHRLQWGFWDFSKHHNFIPRVCRPYRGQTKGKVERFIHCLRHSFYNPLVVELKPYNIKRDIGIANHRVIKCLDSVANCRLHATTNSIPFEKLNEEKK